MLRSGPPVKPVTSMVQLLSHLLRCQEETAISSPQLHHTNFTLPPTAITTRLFPLVLSSIFLLIPENPVWKCSSTSVRTGVVPVSVCVSPHLSPCEAICQVFRAD